MTDALTDRLRDVADIVRPRIGTGAELRRAAERGRRARRLAGGGLSVFALALMLGSGLGANPRTVPAPAFIPDQNVSPSQRATGSGGPQVLAADPLMTGFGWAQFLGDGSAPLRVRVTSSPPRLECVGDPRGLRATEIHAATYLWQPAAGSASPRGVNVEYVLRYDEEARASRALADLRGRFARCHRQQRNPPFLEPDPGWVRAHPGGLLDETFGGGGQHDARGQADGTPVR